MDQNSAFFGRSWALLTRDKGWIKPILVLTCALFVPIVGALGVSGYGMEWARLTAWGVDSSPKQKDVRVGECIKSGFRVLVVGLGYGLAAGFVNAILLLIFSNNAFGMLLTTIVSVAASLFGAVASLRATIYQSIGAGYQVNRIWEMIRKEPTGLAKVCLVMLLMGFIVGIAISILFTLALIPMITSMAFGLQGISGSSFRYLSSYEQRYIVGEIFKGLGAAAPFLIVVTFVATFAMVIVTLIGHTALALWMRQFNVPSWGRSEDPLPTPGGLPTGGASYAGPYGQQPYAPGENYSQPAQPGQQYGQPAQPGQPYAQQPYVQGMPYGQPNFDPQTGQPYVQANQPYPQPNFDPMTGEPYPPAQPYAQQYADPTQQIVENPTQVVQAPVQQYVEQPYIPQAQSQYPPIGDAPLPDKADVDVVPIPLAPIAVADSASDLAPEPSLDTTSNDTVEDVAPLQQEEQRAEVTAKGDIVVERIDLTGVRAQTDVEPEPVDTSEVAAADPSLGEVASEPRFVRDEMEPDRMPAHEEVATGPEAEQNETGADEATQDSASKQMEPQLTDTETNTTSDEGLTSE